MLALRNMAVVVLLLEVSIPMCSKGHDMNISSSHFQWSDKKSSIVTGRNRFSLMNSRISRRPRKKNMDQEQLMDLLGKFFDEEWMSIEKPPNAHQKEFILPEDTWHYQELVHSVHSSNLTAALSDILGVATVDQKLVFALRKWLLQRASCPVAYWWEDIGPMFWPRWLKLGHCVPYPGSCSWPPGMHCVETGRSSLEVLRWQCRLGKNKATKRKEFHSERDWNNKRFNEEVMSLRCHWIRVPYPIITSCQCTC